MNRVILIGNIGRDPEIRTTQGGDKVASFSLATSERWKDKTSGDRKESTTWHRCVAWGPLVKVIEEYTSKGSKVAVEGSISVRQYVDNKSSEEKTVTEIKVSSLELLDSKNGSSGERTERPQKAAAPASASAAAELDDEIPF